MKIHLGECPTEREKSGRIDIKVRTRNLFLILSWEFPKVTGKHVHPWKKKGHA